MSENVQEKKSSSKIVIVLLIVLIVLVIGGIITAAILLNRNKDDSSADGEAEGTQITIGYENNGVVVIDEGEFQKLFEEMQRTAEEGMIDVQYRNIASSYDGVHFDCSIGNAITNEYDMYLNIYLDYDTDQQILLTGLIPPGNKIETFESEIKLDPGEYESVLVFTQVTDDHASIHAQSMVVLKLVVYDGEENATVTFVEE